MKVSELKRAVKMLQVSEDDLDIVIYLEPKSNRLAIREQKLITAINAKGLFAPLEDCVAVTASSLVSAAKKFRGTSELTLVPEQGSLYISDTKGNREELVVKSAHAGFSFPTSWRTEGEVSVSEEDNLQCMLSMMKTAVKEKAVKFVEGTSLFVVYPKDNTMDMEFHGLYEGSLLTLYDGEPVPTGTEGGLVVDSVTLKKVLKTLQESLASRITISVQGKNRNVLRFEAGNAEVIAACNRGGEDMTRKILQSCPRDGLSSIDAKDIPAKGSVETFKEVPLKKIYEVAEGAGGDFEWFEGENFLLLRKKTPAGSYFHIIGKNRKDPE